MWTGLSHRDENPLVDHFGRTLFVGIQPSDAEFDAFVEQFHPDVVIEERVERNMRIVPVASIGSVKIDSLAEASVLANQCSESRQVAGTGVPDNPVAANANLRHLGAGLQVMALNDDPYLILPETKSRVSKVVVSLTAPVGVEVQLYGITDTPDWTGNPLSISIPKGQSEITFTIRKDGIRRFRLDPGDKAGTYLVHNISFFSGCR